MCALADMALEVKFNWGVVTFGIGHVLYCTAYLLNEPFVMTQLYVFLALMALVVVLIVVLKKHLKAYLVPFSLYSIVLCTMVCLALTQPVLLKVGAVLFVLSDALLAKNILFGASKKMDYVTLFTYYLAQFLIGASVLF